MSGFGFDIGARFEPSSLIWAGCGFYRDSIKNFLVFLSPSNIYINIRQIS